LFDAVLCFRALHVVEEPALMLEEAHRVLKPEGILITATDCHAENTNVKARVMDHFIRLLHTLGILPVLRFFTYKDMTRIIESASFHVTAEQELEFDGKKGLYVRAVKV
jgi:ubiquinone/menaquinone biosynthesis C-methylase UbiE